MTTQSPAQVLTESPEKVLKGTLPIPSAGEPAKALRRRSGDRYDNLKRSHSFTDTDLSKGDNKANAGKTPAPIYSASTSNVAAAQMVSKRGNEEKTGRK